MFIAAFILSYFSAFTILLPFIGVFLLAARTRKENLNTDIFYISIYILIITLAQALLFIYCTNRIRNYFLFNAFYPVEFSLFLFLVLQWFDEIKIFSGMISILVFVGSYVVIGLAGSENEFPFMLVLLESAIIIPLSFNSVIRMAKKTFDIYRLIMFKGILFCTLGNLVMVGFMKSSLNEANIIQSVLNIYANYLFLKSFIKYGR